jgi:hypothetical protein
MITEEERQSIINEAKEQTLLAIPEVIGNLIQNHLHLIKLNKKFYDEFPEFNKNRDLVAQVVEYVEGKNPGIDYEQVLKQAVPVIRERMKTVKSLDLKNITKPNRNLSSLKLSDNGEL